MRLRGKEKSNEINIDVDMKRTCHTYQTLIHHDFKKGEMQHADYIDKRTGQRAFGELRYMGADYCYKYDKETRKKTEEVEALKLHLGSMKLGNSVDIRLEATELPKVEPYTVVELEEAVYAPYVQRGNFPVLVDRISCKGIRVVTGKGNVQRLFPEILCGLLRTA